MTKLLVELELDINNEEFIAGESDPVDYILAELGWIEESGISLVRIVPPTE